MSKTQPELDAALATIAKPLAGPKPDLMLSLPVWTEETLQACLVAFRQEQSDLNAALTKHPAVAKALGESVAKTQLQMDATIGHLENWLQHKGWNV